MMKTNYDVHEELYIDARRRGWDGWGGNDRIQKSELVTRFLDIENRPTHGRLLEIGCGEGHHCRSFAKLGYDVTGIDISKTAIEWAKEKSQLEGLSIAYEVQDLASGPPTPKEKYDVVIDGNCLHCIVGTDRTAVLDWVFHSLATSGTFFVSSLCSKSDSSYQIPKDNFLYRHVTSRTDLITELENTGFTVREVKVYERNTTDHITVYATKQDRLLGKAFVAPLYK